MEKNKCSILYPELGNLAEMWGFVKALTVGGFADLSGYSSKFTGFRKRAMRAHPQ